MLNDLLVAFQAVATLENFLIMAAGIWGGVIIGAIPGMTGTMAVTLALPFTFYMQPIPSILLLVALYKGSTYGGSVSAILIKTPGTASAACTTLDGYPLAQQGKAGKALNMALYSSCTGDFISNLSLIFYCRTAGAPRVTDWATRILYADDIRAHYRGWGVRAFAAAWAGISLLRAPVSHRGRRYVRLVPLRPHRRYAERSCRGARAHWSVCDS
ncbi:hypothetical protein HORIV_69470 [Vreelandella olivaria]|uniref:DUF112 domain-containing protein n=1 Tax=Vreelandella olivaria TaxID=390919 RepID=A0ABN5XDC3_9GAMM|nr:hypothetical protein HORIV_69470 [Halomonas olivaria]